LWGGFGLLLGIRCRWKNQDECNKENECTKKQRDVGPSTVQSKSPDRSWICKASSGLLRPSYNHPTVAMRASDAES